MQSTNSIKRKLAINNKVNSEAKLLEEDGVCEEGGDDVWVHVA